MTDAVAQYRVGMRGDNAMFLLLLRGDEIEIPTDAPEFIDGWPTYEAAKAAAGAFAAERGITIIRHGAMDEMMLAPGVPKIAGRLAAHLETMCTCKRPIQHDRECQAHDFAQEVRRWDGWDEEAARTEWSR